MDAKIKPQTRAEKRLEILRKGDKLPYVEMRPGYWYELALGVHVVLVKSDMHGCRIEFDVR